MTRPTSPPPRPLRCLLRPRSLASNEKTFGSDHPFMAQSLENLVKLYRKIDRVKEAEPLEERAKAIRAIKR